MRLTPRRVWPALLLLPVLWLAAVAPSQGSVVSLAGAKSDGPASVTATSATFKGRVNPGSLLTATTYWFEYGTTKSYGQRTPVQSAGTGLSWVTVAQPVTGLAPDTKYHYRLVASNLGLTANGDDKEFTTKKGAATPSDPGTGTDPGTGSDSGSSGSGSSGSGSGDSGSGSSGSGSGSSDGSGSGDDNSGSSSGNAGSGSDNRGSGSDDSGSDGSPGADDLKPGHTVGVTPDEGMVKVKKPGSKSWGAVPLSGVMPVGSVIDATNGKVRLVSGLPGGHTQAATFWGGVFQVGQSSSGMTDIHLRGAMPKGCAARGLRAGASRKRRRRGLWASDNHGRYRTHGRNSVATVRGTTWRTTETCSGTLTFVREGAVSVRDRHRHRTVTVRAGHAYLARSAR